MKRLLPVLLALLLTLQATACAAPVAVSVTRAEADQLELSLDGVPESMLITAVYFGGRMVDSVVTSVLAGTATVITRFHGDLPEGSILKSFVLDKETAKPLLPASELTLPESGPRRGRVLVACFSATNNTQGIAQHIQAVLGDEADLYEITPEVPYTSADLNYNTDCRANREQNDPTARPAISGSVDNMERYDVVFLGYPIWWGVAPKIIHTFLESYDFTGKTVIPFCTSGSSSYNDSTIKPLAPTADWRTGRRFSAGASRDTVEAWIDSLGLELNKGEDTAMNKLTVSFSGHTYTATLEDNATAEAFAQLLQSKGGSMTIPMREYGGWEKVGSLGQTLPRNDTQTTTAAGDFVLYSGNQIVLFYGSNTWDYTRLGRLDDPSGLQDALGSGNLDITFALAQ